MTPGQVIKLHRKKMNLSQQGLANKLSMSRSALANIEVGSGGPRHCYVKKICQALKIDPNELFQWRKDESN